MLLCNLPEDILAIVLRWCALDSYDATDSLKRNLPLLAVCRQWRHLAMPLVYSRAFVQYGKQEAINNLSTGDPSEEEPANVAAKTNLDLVAMNGCVRAVKRVQVDVHFLTNPFPGWREAIQTMRTVASKWRVVELKVAMHPSPYSFEARNVDMTRHTDDIAKVGDALAALMPDVRRLCCRGINPNPFARSLYGRLAGHYADQLQMLDSFHAITMPMDCRLPRLRKFSTSYEQEADYQLPQIVSGELVDMSFTSGPSNHSWAPFSADSDSRVIEFPNLKRLNVEYCCTYREGGAAVRHRDGHPWKLHFPSLRSLDIYCSQGTCPLLEYAVLPPRMESIHIEINPAASQDIAHLVLPETRYFSLVVYPGSRGDPSGLPVVNRILERARGSEILGLTIEEDILPVVPESITCTTLTYLSISAPTSVDTMLALIETLPNLTTLTFFDLDLSDVRADISVPGANEVAIVKPLHSSLKSLAINYNPRRHSPDMEVAAAVLKYMLFRTTTLAQLWSEQTPKDPVLSFVEEHAPCYPHLRGVELRLKCGRGPTNSRRGFVLRV